MSIKVGAITAGAILLMMSYAWGFMPYVSDHWPRYHFVAGLGWLAVGNFYFLGMARFLRCPHCGRRFGWNNYVQNGWAQPWPHHECPNCGEDVYKTTSDRKA